MARRDPAKADRALLEGFWREPVERTVLANGLTVLVRPDAASTLASVQVWVRTGSIHEGDHLGAGLSHFLEHMLFKGTERRSGREISASVQAAGGYNNAYTTFDRTVYYIDLPAERFESAVDILADMVLHSTLPEDEVTREKDVILREIAMTQDDPDSRLWESVFATAFREHPYRQPVIGHRDVFAAVDRAALMGYYRRRYVPNNMVVVIAGSVDPGEARAAAERHFGAAPRSALAPVLVPGEPLQLGPRRLNRTDKVEVVRAALTWPVPGLADPGSPALDLLAIILGGGESSVLWREVREKRGLVHTIDASAWNPGTSGLFGVSFTCDAGLRQKAEDAVLGVLARHARAAAFSPAQVRKAYRQSLSSEVNARKTVSGQASRIGMAEVVVGDLDYGRTYFGDLARVRPADLAAAVRRHLVPARLTSVSLEPPGEASAKPPAAAHSGASGFDEVRLPNGARIVLQRDRRLPNVHFRFLTFGGPLAEAPGRRGSSALLATLLTKDTRRRSAAEVARAIEEVGGSFTSFSGDNTVGLAAEVLPTDCGLAVDLIAQAVLSPAFAASTLATEKRAHVAAIREENDDVVSLARRLARRLFFGRHPFAIGSMGEEKDVEATGASDLSGLWCRLLVGEGSVLGVAGDFDPRALVPRLKAFMSRIPRGAPLGPGPAFRPRAPEGTRVERQPREQAVLFEAYPGPAIDAPDYYAGEVADELFSGMASRLFERVRDQKGLAYFVRSSRVACRSAAMFAFVAGTQPGKEDQVFEEITAEIARVAAGEIPDEELRRCQVRLKAGQRKALQANSARAMQAAIDTLQGRGPNHSARYDDLVDAVTVGDLVAFAKARLRPESRMRLVVRP
ncbi:MAG TPA: pitrilysin family protein [Opitutaceae bacterium]|jgi:zinc protease